MFCKILHNSSIWENLKILYILDVHYVSFERRKCLLIGLRCVLQNSSWRNNMREPKKLDNSIRLFCSNLFVFTNISYIIPKQGFQVKVKEWPTSCYLSCCFLNDLQWTSILSFLDLRSLLFLSWVINAVVPEKDNCYYLSMSLKYGFCNKSFQKDEPLTS